MKICEFSLPQMFTICSSYIEPLTKFLLGTMIKQQNSLLLAIDHMHEVIKNDHECLKHPNIMYSRHRMVLTYTNCAAKHSQSVFVEISP